MTPFRTSVAVWLCIVVPASAASGISGIWADAPSGCKSREAVKITVRAFGTQNIYCSYDPGYRTAKAIIWDGVCYLNGRRSPPSGTATISAYFRNGKLTLDGPGFRLENLRRCPPVTRK